MSERLKKAEKLKEMFGKKLEEFRKNSPPEPKKRCPCYSCRPSRSAQKVFGEYLDKLGGVRTLNNRNDIFKVINEESLDAYAFEFGFPIATIVVEREMAERYLVLGLP